MSTRQIEIVGPGCRRCIATEDNVKEAVKQLGIECEIIHVRDVTEFAKKKIMFTPGVIVDGVVKISGRIPTVDEIKNILSSGK